MILVKLVKSSLREVRFTSHLSDSSLLDISFIILPWRHSEAVQRQKPQSR